MAKKASAGKPKKPYKDFPLFPHAAGVWAKKIRGKLYYFGPWSNPHGALEKYLDEQDALRAGRTPRRRNPNGVSLADVCNHFLTHKNAMLAAEEIAPRTFQRYHTACTFLTTALGRDRLVDDLVADDFQHLRAEMVKRWGPVAVGNEIQMVRTIFKHGYDVGLYDKPIRFGPGFKKPSAKTLRKNRAKGGLRMVERDELLTALDAAGANMKAMILLGINGALGNTDVGLLPTKAVNLKTGWLDYPRDKTAIDRQIPLWPETSAAIQNALARRHAPTNPSDCDLLFIGPRGQNYIGNHKGYRVTAEMTRLLKKTGLTRPGLSFYCLRRTFQTIAEGSLDLLAVSHIMGHAPPAGDMASIYRQRVTDARLRAVTDYVRDWLFDRKGIK